MADRNTPTFLLAIELADTVRRNAQVLAHYSGSDAGRAAQATIDEALALLVSMARGNR